MKKILIAPTFFAFALMPLSSQLNAAEVMHVPNPANVEVKDTKVMHSDEDIAKSLKGAFAADARLNSAAAAVNVAVKDGVVTLSGNVPDERFKWEFGHKAKQTAGVKSVVNNIEVLKDAAR